MCCAKAFQPIMLEFVLETSVVGLEQIEMFRGVHKVDTLAVWLGGDMITGAPQPRRDD